MALYLLRIQPVRPAMLTEGPTEWEAAMVAQHFAYLEKLTEQGVVKLAGRTLTTDYSSYGIILFAAADAAAAGALVENDPAIKNRVMRAEFHPFRIALLGQIDQE